MCVCVLVCRGQCFPSSFVRRDSKSTASRNFGARPNPTTRLNNMGHACKRYQTISKRERERFAKAQKKMPLGIGETFARSFVEMCHSVLKRIPSNDICWVLTCAHKYHFQDIPTHVETISRTPTSGCMSGLSSYHTLALPGLRLAELQKGTQVHVAGTESFDVIGDLCSQGSGDWEMGCQTSEGFLQISAVCLVEPQLQHKSAKDIATAHLTTSSTVTTQMRLDSDEVWQWKAMFILFVHWFPLSACRIRCVILLLRRSYLCEKTRVCEGWSWWVSGSTDFVAEQRILPGLTLCVEWSGISRIENYNDLNQMSPRSSSFNGLSPGEVKGATTECFQVEVQGTARGDVDDVEDIWRYMKIWEHSSNTAALPSFSEFIGDYGWVPSLVDERASTFLRAAIMHNWDRLCSWICPQDTNFALLPYQSYQPYQLISVPSLKLRSTPDHWGHVTILAPGKLMSKKPSELLKCAPRATRLQLEVGCQMCGRQVPVVRHNSSHTPAAAVAETT